MQGAARARFLVQPMNLVDLVAIMPYYAGLALSSGGSSSSVSFVRVVRLARIFRLFKAPCPPAARRPPARSIVNMLVFAEEWVRKQVRQGHTQTSSVAGSHRLTQAQRVQAQASACKSACTRKRHRAEREQNGRG